MAHPLLEQLFSASTDDHGSSHSAGRRHLVVHASGHPEPHPSDPQLERIRSGDTDVFAELYEVYFTDLSAFAFRYVRDPAAAEDVVHDVFLKLWSFRNNLEVQTTLRAYLFSMVANRSRDITAKRRHDDALFVPSEHRETALSNIPHEKDSSQDTLESSEIRQKVMAAVATLPERQHLAITLRLTNDMTYDEIATILGITKSSVAELITKAQGKLKVLLRPLLP